MSKELSDYIDYGDFYARYIDDPRFSRTKMQQAVRCPFLDHDDRNASFSINLRTSKWNCFGCGRSGNIVEFYAIMHGVSTTDAYKALCEEYSIPKDEAPPQPQQKKAGELAPLTLEEYAAAKHIDKTFLASRFLLKDAVLGGVSAVAMPYLTKDMHLFRKRVRAGQKAMRWGSKGAAWEDGKTPLYGIHLLPEDAPEVVLVEGESDTQTLCFLGFDAVGAAGASMFNEAAAESLGGRKVIVHDDGDKGGQVFLSKVAGTMAREVFSFRCRDIDKACKDPSDILIKYGKERASELLRAAVASAQPIRPKKNLEAPAGYFVSSDGVFKDSKDYGMSRITSTPLYLRSVVRCCETGTEKLEVGYSVRGEERSKVFPREVVLNSRKVVDVLSPLGINASSSNVSQIVEYLSACDAEQGHDLPMNESVPHLGWVDEGRFAPIASGATLLDLDDGMRHRADFVTCCGDLETWAAAMAPSRFNVTFRFLLASSFASPLVRIVSGRPMFVHVWESSRGGKTAALKAALSVWGNPDRLMTTFRSTLNAMCSLAELMCDLPVGIDERQMVQGSRQQEIVEEAVYTLAGGHRKDRSTVSGGLQRSGVWNCVFITTGEVPLLESSTMTGAATRTIELNEKPFSSEGEAKYMHNVTARQHGTAGRAFIAEVMRIGWDGVRDLHLKMLDGLNSLSPYADMVALVGVADYLASKACFGEDDWDISVAMASEVLAKLKTAEDIDVNRAAVEFIAEWIQRNAKDFDNSFSNKADIGSRDGMKTMIYRSAIEPDMVKAGYNVNKTLKYMADQGIIDYEEIGAKRQYTKKIMRKGVRARMIVIMDWRLDEFLTRPEAGQQQQIPC